MAIDQIDSARAPAVAKEPDQEEGGYRLWIIGAGVFLVIQLWFGMSAGSLWLDETGTWWIVKNGPAEAIHRALTWSGQSPLYYLIAWLSSRAFGLNEIALRLPSMLAMAGALYFLYRIADRLLGKVDALTVTFVFLYAGAYYAVDARPYALALLCLVASMWFLLRWVENSRWFDAIGYVLSASLLVYAHVVLAVGLAAGILYAAVSLRKEARRLICFAGLELLTGVLCTPLLGELRKFYASRASHTYSSVPLPENLLVALIPCSVAGGLILIVWLSVTLRRETRMPGRWLPNAPLLIGTWSLFAPLFFFLLAVFTDIRLFVPKYFSSALPGQALLAGGLLASIERSTVRKALVIVMAILAILTSGRLAGYPHGGENWRDALKFLKQDAGPSPVLLVSGFVEASDFAHVSDPKLRDVLFAPELIYGEPNGSIHLPNSFYGAANPDMEGIARQLRREPRFYLLTENPDRSYEMWLLGAMTSAGRRCKSESLYPRFGYLWVNRFTCQ